MDRSSQYDLEEIQQKWNSAGPSERHDLERLVADIMNRSGYTRSARESLIREMRAGNTANVRDISEQMKMSRNIMHL